MGKNNDQNDDGNELMMIFMGRIQLFVSNPLHGLYIYMPIAAMDNRN